MSGQNTSTPESQITSDPNAIQAWGEEHGMVPVEYEEGGKTHLALVPETDVEEKHRQLSWDEFGTEMDQQGQVVVRRGDEEPDMSVMDRSEIVGSATVETEGIEDALLEGETVETQLTERTVVEHTIVEEATVESEIVDREVVESETVDVELLTREIDHCSATPAAEPEETPATVERFQPGTPLEEAYDVELEVDEGWTLTKEVVERITIESRIVDTDAQETETIQSDTFEEQVDIEGVQERVLEGELVDSPQTAEEVVENCHVESEFGQGDAITTELLRRRTVEEEMSVRKEFTGQITDGETLTADAIARTVVESEVVGEDEYDVDLLAGETTAVETEATVETEEPGETEAVVETDEETVVAEQEETVVADDEEEVVEAEEPVETAEPVTPTHDEEGKTVVNASGDEIGMVVDVDDGTMFVDPHPSITDKIRTALGWGDHDDDTYPVDNDDVARIENDEVVLGVERSR